MLGYTQRSDDCMCVVLLPTQLRVGIAIYFSRFQTYIVIFIESARPKVLRPTYIVIWGGSVDYFEQPPSPHTPGLSRLLNPFFSKPSVQLTARPLKTR